MIFEGHICCWHIHGNSMVIKSYSLLSVQRIDWLMQRAEKWPNILTIYNIIWWLPFLHSKLCLPTAQWLLHALTCPVLWKYLWLVYIMYVKHEFQLHLWRKKFKIFHSTWPLLVQWLPDGSKLWCRAHSTYWFRFADKKYCCNLILLWHLNFFIL